VKRSAIVSASLYSAISRLYTTAVHLSMQTTEFVVVDRVFVVGPV